MILLDMDGVLVDFVGAANALHDRPDYIPDRYDYWTEWGITEDDFWRPINELGEAFWANLPLYDWAEDLIHYCLSLDNIFVATKASTRVPSSTAGKIKSIKRIFGASFDDFAVISDKSRLAARGRILIDDHPTNCFHFQFAGGQAIVFPRPWNGLYWAADRCYDYTRHELTLRRAAA